jgi:repressor LexA
MARRPRYLTERQKQILDFLQTFTAEHGIAPTHREICERFGYSSYGTVYKHLKLLQDKGFLRREWNQKRGIEVVERPAGGRPTPEVELPYFGRIAAGRPVEAFAGEETLVVPRHLLGGRNGEREHYVLEVIGESMIDEGIHDGDLVVVQRREIADAGEMVVALVGSEATLKRFFPEGETVRLQPANPNMEPIRVAADDVQVQGIVVGLMRKF